MIDVIDPGPLTTVQDEGRFGLAHLGISPGGAADPIALALANRLVGNSRNEAVLEMTLKGGKFYFVEDTVFAVTGADFRPRLDDMPVPLWRSMQARAGQELHFGLSADGARCYLAVRDGFQVEPLLGSRSAMVSASFGHRVKKDERLVCARSEDGTARYVLQPPLFSHELSVIPGPYWEDSLLGDFTVTEHANRSGIRLNGTPIKPPRAGEAASEGVIWGTIQAPGSGQILILMNEQQTTGGYPVVGYVQAADRMLLAQLRPHAAVKFRPTDIASAARALREQARWLERAVHS